MNSKSSFEFGGIPELFVVGFDGFELPADIAVMLASGLAGVAIFRRNIRDRAQLTRLCSDIREAARPSGMVPIISVDQEGGRVQRLRDIGRLYPPMRGVVDAFEAGLSIGAELREIGFNVDFAPVLDTDTNPLNPIIGDRAFSDDPSVVAGCAVDFFRGLAAAGIAGCGKHFPGHGDASADSHLELPEICVGMETLARRELLPFEAAVKAGFGMMMTAHCLFPAIDAELPATLSERFIRPILRDRFGFRGVVISDDLGMKAIADRFGPDRVVELGVRAGVDIFLHCGIVGEACVLMSALDEAIRTGRVQVADAAASVSRVRAFRSGLPA
jgi:beta-N-acetylhexosaminidase